jgi:hypothetical protein
VVFVLDTKEKWLPPLKDHELWRYYRSLTGKRRSCMEFNDLKTGTTFEEGGQPWLVLTYEH